MFVGAGVKVNNHPNKQPVLNEVACYATATDALDKLAELVNY